MGAIEYAGRDRSHALYRGRGTSVVVDIRRMTAEVMPAAAAETARPWAAGGAPDGLCAEVAEAALRHRRTRPGVLELDNSLRRGYTVPRNVAASAGWALRDPGLTPMSALAAAALAPGGQVRLSDVLWAHRFFEGSTRDEAGPLRWAAWGGTEGRAWASGLAARLEYDSVVADCGRFEVPGLAAFGEGDDDERAFWASMTAAGRADGLFRLGPDGGWLCWGNGDWRPAAAPRNRAELDDETAVFAAGALLDAPDRPVDLRELDPAEWALAAAGLPGLDWPTIGRATLADDGGGGGGDGEYTPEERSKNAAGQLRDASGRFAQVGDQGLMKSGLRGKISTLNEQGNQIVVDAEDGNSYMIDPKDFTIDGPNGGSTAPGKPDPSKILKPLDLSGILGQPRAVASTPKAWLKKVLQPMGPAQLKKVVDNYEGFINEERQQRAGDFKGGTGWQEARGETPKERRARRELEADRDRNYREYERISRRLARQRAVFSVRADGAGAPSPNEESPGAEHLDPLTSDVEPLYLAIVDREDPRAVMELVAMIPAGPSSKQATTYKRAGGEWVEDPKILQDMRSATPPPVVKLTPDDYAAVVDQVDSEPAEPEGGAEAPAPVTAAGQALRVEGDGPRAVLSLVSAGGADRNRGNAEQLRRYWTVGKGGLKIRWNTGGDWRRCVRLLSKHLGVRSKGYCALRHHEMTGMWPGDRRNLQGYALSPGGPRLTSLEDVPRRPAVLRAAFAAAGQWADFEAAMARVRGEPYRPSPPTAADVEEGRSGRAFVIPIVVPEGLDSGDKRHFQKGSLGIRTLPLPLLWQEKTGDGHDGSPIVGRIDHVERVPDGLGNAYGVFDTGPYGQEAQRLVENNMLRWVSVDLDKFEPNEDLMEIDPDGKMTVKKGRMMGATLVPKPAFQESTVELLPHAEEPEEEGIPAMDAPAPLAVAASAAIAEAIPVEPPAAWFERPDLPGPSPIRVTDEGRVFGHVATWTTQHIGMAGQTRPPRSRSGYAYFHTGLVRTAEGKDAKVGQLTLAGGHADLRLNAEAAARHYDDTHSAVADVHAGEDSHGIWVAGALRPGTTPHQVRALRASAPSGDWRLIGGGLEMVAVCQVNVPGFPVPQALAASGRMASLVAAGSADLAELQARENERTLEALAAAASQRVFLALDPDGYLTEFKTFPAEKRDALAKEGKALKDGSFPIENAADLRRAVQAYGRTTKEKQAKVRRHIVKRARALGKPDLIPDGWREAALSDRSIANRDKYEAMVASARAAKAQALADRVNAPALQAEAASLAARVWPPPGPSAHEAAAAAQRRRVYP